MLGHDTRCSLLLHPEHDERQNRDSSVHINILTIQRWKVVSVGKRPVKLTGSIVKAFITCWWAVNALCTKQPPACDTSTHTRWLYNAFITAIRSSEEAERPLTCVKAAQHTSHIAADSQGWRLEAGGGSAVLTRSILWRSLWPEQWRTGRLPGGRAWNLSRGIEEGKGNGGAMLSRD